MDSFAPSYLADLPASTLPRLMVGCTSSVSNSFSILRANAAVTEPLTYGSLITLNTTSMLFFSNALRTALSNLTEATSYLGRFSFTAACAAASVFSFFALARRPRLISARLRARSAGVLTMSSNSSRLTCLASALALLARSSTGFTTRLGNEAIVVLIVSGVVVCPVIAVMSAAISSAVLPSCVPASTMSLMACWVSSTGAACLVVTASVILAMFSRTLTNVFFWLFSVGVSP